jgi:2',3'-cyclic-nucleotide 2'-phosphodiesterase (5'-nucleotidase family)
MEAVVHAYGERLGRELDVVIGKTSVALEGRRGPLRSQETTLGDVIADAMRGHAKTDVALVNGGGIRSDRIIPPGPLTRRDLAAMSPFGNVVMTLELTGRTLGEVLEQALPQREREAGGFLQVSGLTVSFDPARPAGQRIVTIEVGGAPLDPDRRYTAAVVDYIANGKDGLTAFTRGRVLVDAMSAPLLADILLRAVSGGRTIAPETDGRIRTIPTR